MLGKVPTPPVRKRATLNNCCLFLKENIYCTGKLLTKGYTYLHSWSYWTLLPNFTDEISGTLLLQKQHTKFSSYTKKQQGALKYNFAQAYRSCVKTYQIRRVYVPKTGI